MNAEFETWSKHQRTHINSGLHEALKGKSRIVEITKYPLTTGGKRIRPLLTLAASRSLGLPNNPIALQYGIAVELIHTYSLVHDDLPCMDDDDERRGKPTVHKHFDVPSALLAGDALLTHAFGALTAIDSPNMQEAVTKLVHAAGANGMIGGQSLDIGLEGPIETSEQLTKLHQMKTGALISVATELGALSACATSEDQQNLAHFGAELGLAFQLADDVLDAEEDADENGPPSFVKFYGVEETLKKANTLIDSAKSRIECLSNPDMLLAIADFTVQRKY